MRGAKRADFIGKM